MESYYREQAAICADAASATALQNVIDRFRRSEQAWLVMADRAATHARIKATVRV